MKIKSSFGKMKFISVFWFLFNFLLMLLLKQILTLFVSERHSKYLAAPISLVLIRSKPKLNEF